MVGVKYDDDFSEDRHLGSGATDCHKILQGGIQPYSGRGFSPFDDDISGSQNAGSRERLETPIFAARCYA